MIIYNSSAGSGKTFSITKKYLELIISSKDTQLYKKILTITFTNNSAKEMKDRILSTLYQLSEDKNENMLDEIQKSTKLAKDNIINKAKRLLENIINDYSSINICTIDSFYNRLIKSFSSELDLSFNYSLETKLPIYN